MTPPPVVPPKAGPDPRDAFLLGGLLLMAFGLGAWDWRAACAVVGAVCVAIALFSVRRR